MTQEEKAWFIQVAQMGWACGLEHPYEWYEQAIAHENLFAPGVIEKIEQAFVSFFQNCGSYPGDPIESITAEQLADNVNRYFLTRIEQANYEN